VVFLGSDGWVYRWNSCKELNMTILAELKKKIPNSLHNSIRRNLLNNPLFTFLYRKYVAKFIRDFEKNKKMPPIVSIELTNDCNASCIICPRDKLDREVGYMDDKLYQKIIDDVTENNISNVRLSNFGESLLDKNIVGKVRHAKKRGLKVSFFTNGQLLTEKISRKLVGVGLDEIFISIDSLDREEYGARRRGLSYDLVIRNIKGLKKIRDKKKMVKPNIVIVYTKLRKKNGASRFKKYLKGIADTVYMKDVSDWAGQKNIASGRVNLLRKWPCAYLWETMVINWDGDAALCCVDFNCKNKLGNLKRQTIRQVWFGREITRIRKLHKDNKMHTIQLCRNCKNLRLWSIVEY